MQSKNVKKSRRSFIKKAALGTIGLSVGMSAKSYGQIMGSNDRVNFGIAGLHGRGGGLIGSVASAKNTSIGFLCDVDSKVLAGAAKKSLDRTGGAAKTYGDVRRMLENKDMDAFVIAAPDHWHATMTIMGLAAGKHVYVEKPCGQVPREGEILMEAQKKYPNLRIQMGTQQRSAPTTIEAMQDMKEGIIGEVNYAKAWYNNNRKSIGIGKHTAVPDELDWDLWQGPAPRKEYKDNWVHYNWHWFREWGTGEACNNATHEVDIARWALGVDYPTKVKSTGGRYHFQEDDWEFYDTQIVNYEFENGKSIVWEGMTCNAFKDNSRGRGTTIHGTEGTIMLDRNKYIAWDRSGRQFKEVREKAESATTNIVGEGALDVYHMNNFLDGVREGAELHTPIDTGHKTVLLCHLANIAQTVGETLNTDPKNGNIIGNEKAEKMWGRKYNTGWELKV